jgi:hypothetical protein
MSEAGLVACRVCGARGSETQDDPCPGLCPACFDDALAVLTARLLSEVLEGDQTPPRLIERHARRLRELGVTERHVGFFVRGAREALRQGRVS